MSGQVVPNPTAQKTLAFILAGNEISKRYQGVLQEKQAQDAQVATLIPDVVKALETNERIFGHQKEAVATALQDPVKCLELLRDVACHRNSGEVESIGNEIGNVKTASDKGPTPYAGQAIADHDETKSGRDFRDQILGGAGG